ncbi:unnamed protein product [Lupinus luteus]|uniref:S-protein homolog n=1 Tax=Lupinus luteus TaxID=3873 RepID=A0AAV1X6Q7_LUPLU
MNKIVLSSFMFVTIFVTIQMVYVEAFNIGIAKDERVTFFNNLTVPLVVSCRDKDRIVEYETVDPGNGYSLKFTVFTLIPSSLWYCNFVWLREDHNFNIYVQKRDRCSRSGCVWYIKEEGPCKVGGECYKW